MQSPDAKIPRRECRRERAIAKAPGEMSDIAQGAARLAKTRHKLGRLGVLERQRQAASRPLQPSRAPPCLGTATISPVESHCEHCTGFHHNPCQEWPSRIEKAILGAALGGAALIVR